MTSRRAFIRQTAAVSAGLLVSGLPADAKMANEDRAFERLRADIRSYMALLRIPGLVAGVVEDGKVTFIQTEGFANLEKKISMRRDHIFPVASLTKTFAAATLMQYVEEGKISLEDYVLDYPYLSVGFSPERMQNPNVQIRHVLSHTSEGIPGTSYVYNGSRYNLIYGVFEKISGNTHHYDAFAQEVSRRIIEPLKLKDTYPGYPAGKTDLDPSRIAATYLLDTKSKTFSIADKNEPTWTTLFPATNLFTTLDDLAIYTQALDHDLLINAESYKRLTSPFITPGGRVNPYGLGWGTQLFGQQAVHWHYGYGDSFAALIVRVPAQKLSFILFSNSVAPSEACLLGYGNLLNSPFALSFLKNMVAKEKSMAGSHQNSSPLFQVDEIVNNSTVQQQGKLFYDEIFSQALIRYFAEQTFGTNQGEAGQLLRYLAESDPGRFRNLDISLIWLLAKLADSHLSGEMENAVGAYRSSGYFHPEIHEQIAAYYDKTGDKEKSLSWYHALADSKGFEEQAAIRNACTKLGSYYLQQGEKEKGRIYLWREALFSRFTDSGTGDVTQQLALMKDR